MCITNQLKEKPLYSLCIGEFIQLLTELEEQQQTNREKNYGKYLSFSELQELTGYAKQTLYQLSAAKRIPGACKLNSKRVLFETSAIMEWIESSKIATSSETHKMLMRRGRHDQ